MLSIQGGDALAVPGLLLKLACETPHVACSDAAHAAREAHAARTRGEEDARRPGASEQLGHHRQAWSGTTTRGLPLQLGQLERSDAAAFDQPGADLR